MPTDDVLYDSAASHFEAAGRYVAESTPPSPFWRGADGQLAMTFSGPDEAEIERLARDFLVSRGWIVQHASDE